MCLLCNVMCFLCQRKQFIQLVFILIRLYFLQRLDLIRGNCQLIDNLLVTLVEFDSSCLTRQQSEVIILNVLKRKMSIIYLIIRINPHIRGNILHTHFHRIRLLHILIRQLWIDNSPVLHFNEKEVIHTRLFLNAIHFDSQK